RAPLARCVSSVLGAQATPHVRMVISRIVPPTSASTAGAAALDPADAPEGWSTQVLDQAAQKLLAFVGPVARLLVQKIALGTRSEAELYQRLAVAIPEETERLTFLKSVNAAPAAQDSAHSADNRPDSAVLSPELL